jgi:hypothetical protein
MMRLGKQEYELALRGHGSTVPVSKLCLMLNFRKSIMKFRA